MEQWVFWPTALLSITTAVYMAASANPVKSALLLVVNFFTISVFYVLLEAPFLGAVQVIVYAGAIMVLFLFVIMLLGVDRREDVTESIPLQRALAGIAGLLIIATAWLTFNAAFERTPFTGLEQANQAGNTESLGRLLFSEYLFPFEVTSLLLIVAAIGAMVIGKRRAPDRVEPEDEDA